ncbi:hypothetical protein [Roseivivax marinus]|uniref:hypothetical protein n=1 Tax=Roseivivax marinus TaxID=1379903 RepID=UPI00273DEB43|nr:hypothetical protein [Roseivivax marinus]
MPLSSTECEAFSRLGINSAETMSDEEFYQSVPVHAGRMAHARLVGEALPPAVAARRVGVSVTQLRQRIVAGSLMAVHRPGGRDWLVPAFQFTETGEVPHLGCVLLASGRPLSALSMDRFFRIPREDLDGASPRDWLIAGRDSVIIESILAGL